MKRQLVPFYNERYDSFRKLLNSLQIGFYCDTRKRGWVSCKLMYSQHITPELRETLAHLAQEAVTVTRRGHSRYWFRIEVERTHAHDYYGMHDTYGCPECIATVRYAGFTPAEILATVPGHRSFDAHPARKGGGITVGPHVAEWLKNVDGLLLGLGAEQLTGFQC